MQRDLDRLAHMVEAADAIASYIKDIDRSAFFDYPMLQDAVLRRLTVIGEATNKITLPVQTRSNSVPWRRIIGFRNFVVHEYQRVDWGVVARDLPELVVEVKALVLNLAIELGDEGSP